MSLLASKGNTGLAGCGGLIRNGLDGWVGGFCRNMGVCNSITAELWGIKEGLALAWDMGYQAILLESNSQLLVSIL